MHLVVLLLFFGITCALSNDSYNVFQLVASLSTTLEKESVEVEIGEFDLTDKQFTLNANGLPSYQSQWLLGLKQGDTYINSQFQFFVGDLNQFTSGSEILIRLNKKTWDISGISCNMNNQIDGVQIRVLEEINMPSPNLRLKSALTSDENAQVQGSSRQKTQKGSSTEANSEDPEQFSEVVLPSEELPKSNKTFFERNWKFVVPPVLIFILMGFFAEPPEAEVNEKDAVKNKE